MLQLIKVLNRPLSPHLTIYSTQFTSIFSIWHRITGISLVISLVLVLLTLKILSGKLMNSVFFFYNAVPVWIYNSIILNYISFVLYHVINGFRHIMWDLGYNLSILSIYNSIKVVISTIFFINLFLIYKIIM